MKKTLSILALSVLALGSTLVADEVLEPIVTEVDVKGQNYISTGSAIARGATIINTKTLGVVVYDENETATPYIKAPFSLLNGIRIKNLKTLTELPQQGDELILDLKDVLNDIDPTYSLNPAPNWGSYLQAGGMYDGRTIDYVVVNFDNVDFADWYAESPMTITGIFSNGVRATGYIISQTCDMTHNDTSQGGIVFFNETVAPRVLAAEIVPEPTTATLSLLALAGLAMRRRRRA